MNRLIVLLAGLLFFTSCSKEASFERREAFLMDTYISISVEADDRILDEIFARLEEIDKLYNRHDKDSEIYKINKEKSYEPKREVYDLLKRTFDYADITDEAFNPAIGPLVDLWGINGTGKKVDKLPSRDKIEEKRKLSNYEEVSISNGSILLKEGMSIDLGGIIKGYATNEIVNILKTNKVNSAIIDLGGNIYAYGAKPGGLKWRIGIANPFVDNREEVLVLEGVNFSLVTSGDYERFIVYEGKSYHHILDTSTGWPVDNNLASVSIISEDSELCDMLSTAVYVEGMEKGLKIIEKFGVEAIFITKDKEILATKGAYEMINLESIRDGFSLEKIND